MADGTHGAAGPSRLLAAAPWVAGAWLAASAASQIPALQFSRIRSRDYLSLIPNWKFFAPHPATYDLRLFARGRVAGTGEVTDWVDVHPFASRGPASVLWSPRKRAEKSLYDIFSQLVQSFPYEDEDSVRTLPAFHALVDYCARRVRGEEAFASCSSFQFSLIETDGFLEEDAPRVLIVSDEHRL